MAPMVVKFGGAPLIVKGRVTVQGFAVPVHAPDQPPNCVVVVSVSVTVAPAPTLYKHRVELVAPCTAHTAVTGPCAVV